MPYKHNNYFVDFDRIKIHPVIRTILRAHPLSQALYSVADVPEVYVQQVWHTITKNELARPHRFDLQIDQFDSYLSYKRLWLILELLEPNSRPGRTTYYQFSSAEEVFEGIKRLGYVGPLNRVVDFDKLSWPQVPDTEMLFLQKHKKSFTFFMTIPYGLIANYADMTDPSVIDYCLENDFEEAEQEKPSHGTPTSNTNEEQVEANTQVIETDVDFSATPQDVTTHRVESVIDDIEAEATTDVRKDANLDETGVADDDKTNAEFSDDGENTTIIQSTSSALEHTFDQARVSPDKFSTLNDVIRQLSERMDAEKEAQILKLKALFKGKMPEIDTSVIPTEILFRRPSGVVLRESSSAVQSSAPTIMSIPLPLLFTQTAGISSSTHIRVSFSSTPVSDLPISELTGLLYARLLSMLPPEHQDQDLLSLLRNFQPTPPPVSSSKSDRIYVSSTEFQAFRSEVQSSFADLKSFISQTFSDLSSRLDILEQNDDEKKIKELKMENQSLTSFVDYYKKRSKRFSDERKLLREEVKFSRKCADEKKTVELKCIKLSHQISDFEKVIILERENFAKEKKLIEQKNVGIFKEISGHRTNGEMDFEEERNIFETEIKKLTSKLSELSTYGSGTQRKRRREYVEEKLVWKVKPVEDEKNDEKKEEKIGKKKGNKSFVSTSNAKKNKVLKGKPDFVYSRDQMFRLSKKRSEDGAR
ncbi:hypothetical protein L6452_34845 [Arctium lappa]|uniref:Uncharacterized protein n=1 Tax=Arctium lappa TaxID=4217 RepID=A0ACB8YJF6_ARCLA|nr:hypothetical protein L6452_34845 [Arctium lappa]